MQAESIRQIETVSRAEPEAVLLLGGSTLIFE